MTDTEIPGTPFPVTAAGGTVGLVAVLDAYDAVKGAKWTGRIVAERYGLHGDDACDHDDCCDGDHPDPAYMELPRDEIERILRDMHSAVLATVFEHDSPDYRTCTNDVCVTLARVLGKRHQGDDL